MQSKASLVPVQWCTGHAVQPPSPFSVHRIASLCHCQWLLLDSLGPFSVREPHGTPKGPELNRIQHSVGNGSSWSSQINCQAFSMEYVDPFLVGFPGVCLRDERMGRLTGTSTCTPSSPFNSRLIMNKVPSLSDSVLSASLILDVICQPTNIRFNNFHMKLDRSVTCRWQSASTSPVVDRHQLSNIGGDNLRRTFLCFVSCFVSTGS